MSGRPMRVHVICTGRGSHERKHLASGFLHDGQFTWKNAMVEIFAGQSWRGEEGYAGDRYRFSRCPWQGCGLHDVTVWAETLAARVQGIATATRRDNSVDVDLSLLA